MNKRIKKKCALKRLGEKRAGTNYCRNIIGNGIRWRYIEATGTKPKFIHIMKYLRWFYINSSQKEWCDAVTKYHILTQNIFSPKHLLSQPITPSQSSLPSIIERRYGGDRCVINGIKHLLEGDTHNESENTRNK